MPTETPWWLTTILVPICIGVLSGGLPLIASETYRRKSRWEGYAERLWEGRVSLYSDVISAVGDAVYWAFQYATMSDEGDVLRDKLSGRYREADEALRRLESKRLLLLSSDFNKTYMDIEKNLFVVVHFTDDPGERMKRRDVIGKLRIQLLNDARRSLGVDSLDDRAEKIIAEGMKREVEQRRKP